MLFSTFTSSRGKYYCKTVFFFPAHWIYISRCDPSEQRVCCTLSGRRRIFHLQLLWSKEKKYFFWLFETHVACCYFWKKLVGEKAEGKAVLHYHSAACLSLSLSWRHMWLPGKINERTKFKLIKQIRGWLFIELGNCLDISWWVSGVVPSLWTAQWVSKGHHWLALE